MTGNNTKRATRIIAYLGKNPHMLLRYIREGLTKHDITKHDPLKLGLPWLSHSAIDFLEDYLKPEHKVVEFGGGGSTLFFSSRVAHVLCIESNPEWAARIKTELERKGITNVDVELHPYNLHDVEAYKTSSALLRINSEEFDVALIDGDEPKHVKLRPTCFNHVQEKIKKGIIIVDDSWRYPEIMEKNRATKQKCYKATGPYRLGITTTDILHYD